MEVKKVVEEWEILHKEKEAARSEEDQKKKQKKLVLEKFYKQIHVFNKKASERMPTRKL